MLIRNPRVSYLLYFLKSFIFRTHQENPIVISSSPESTPVKDNNFDCFETGKESYNNEVNIKVTMETERLKNHNSVLFKLFKLIRWSVEQCE